MGHFSSGRGHHGDFIQTVPLGASPLRWHNRAVGEKDSNSRNRRATRCAWAALFVCAPAAATNGAAYGSETLAAAAGALLALGLAAGVRWWLLRSPLRAARLA